jgi:hypothetical protein
VLLDGDLADAVEQHERHDEATQAAPDPDLGAHLSLFVDRDRLSHRLHDLVRSARRRPSPGRAFLSE